MFNGRGQSATVIDAKAGKVVATVPLGGKPEFAQADPKAGRVYNNLEDKSEVAVIDTKTHQVVTNWPIASGEEASGMAFDAANHRLFLGCGNKLMVMMDSTIAHEDSPDKLMVVQTLETQRGSRTMTLDPKTHRIYLAAAKFEAPAEGQRRGRMVPGSFKILVYGMESAGK